MHAISTIALLASLATGILGQGLGTFEAFTYPGCNGPSEVINVPDPSSSGSLPSVPNSIVSHLDECLRKFRLCSL